MMPDQGRRVKAQRPALLLQTPAEIDIVACDPKLGIKAPDGLQAVLPKGHVAPRDVLRDLIGEQHMHRTSRSIGHAVRNRAVAGRRHIGAPIPA